MEESNSKMLDKTQNVNYKMLEIKNVTKIYNTKGGVVTHALNDVSISFGETGLVFLLGKSGSGKSTLLNVSGGLDEPTSGEIIVKGKSSRDFTGSDFDSYRNTFVGFIFQEYNILDEFNVEDNIALALELQGKNKDKEKIQAILRDVELEAYAKRKPNTLSGGQKQRIAIARALVKDPQIIMADEPTGALDSATGKQVFDTLKRLSKTRLVIVVSHDREFAEIYGDRIVELADGKIISDVVKTHVSPTEIDENVALIGENTLSIKKGTSLTPENIKTIQEFIQKTEGDVIISNGQKEISSFKKVNRMSESGETEKFKDTPQDIVVHKDYTAEESKFIRSRLPAGKAIRIGASGLKVKPVRLAFTILLSVIAFIMFGLFSTLMLYDGDSVLISSFMDSGSESFNVTKHYVTHYTNDDWTNLNDLRFTDADIEYFKNEFDSKTVGYRSRSVSVSNINVDSKYSNYYSNSINKFIVVPEGSYLRDGLVGTYPEHYNEICISSYTFEVIKESDCYNIVLDENLNIDNSASNQTVDINTKEDLIGKYIALDLQGRNAFKVTGIFDSGAIDPKYDELKTSGDVNFMTQINYSQHLSEGTKLGVLVSDEFFERYKNAFDSYNYFDLFKYPDGNVQFSYNVQNFDTGTETWVDESYLDYVATSGVLGYEDSSVLKKCFFDSRTSDLKDDEVLLNVKRLNNYSFLKKNVISYYMAQSSAETQIEKYYEGEAKYATLCDMIQAYASGGIYDSEKDEYLNLTDEQRLEYLNKAIEVLNKVGAVDVQFQLNNYDGTSRTLRFKIAGFYYLDQFGLEFNDGCIFTQKFIDDTFKISDDRYTAYFPELGQKYDGILIPYDGSRGKIEKLVGMLGVENARENDVTFTLNSSIYTAVDMVNGLAETMSTVFLWVGVVFAVFSSLLLFNFISVSISNKRKEIGILRAVGARGLDVFKIFFSESGIIVGICTLIAIIGTFILCGVINGIVRTDAGIPVSLFVFGPASIGILIAIAVVVAIISTFLPVFFASRKKPVESIRAL